LVTGSANNTDSDNRFQTIHKSNNILKIGDLSQVIGTLAIMPK